MPVLVIGLVLLVLAMAGVWATYSLLGVVVTLLVAAAVGWLADRIVPGELPYGWLGAIGAGLLGSWLGSMIFGRIGPMVGGIPILSVLIGAMILAFAINFFQKRLAHRRTRTTSRLY